MSIKHYEVQGLVYFVTSVTQNREPIFKESEVCRFMLVTIAYYKYILDFALFGYVVMPDHIHLLLQPSFSRSRPLRVGCYPEKIKYSLSKIMNYIKGNFARKFNLWKNLSGHV